VTTATRPRSTPTTQASSGRRDHDLVGTWTLVRFQLRRDRIKLPAWAGGLGLFVLYLVSALPTIAETEEDLQGATQLFSDPVGRLLIGPGYGFDAPTYERFVAGGYGLYFLLLAALMNILLVVRHTRVEEQSGRAELVRANVVGRRAALTATLVVAVITDLAAALVVWVAMVGAGGFDPGGSLLFAASIAAMGLAFAGVTTIPVQLSSYSRAAAGTSGAVLGAAFVLRAGGDAAREGGNALSWTSPLGWGQQTAPFVLDRWWPLALLLALAVVTAAAGYALAERRDLGASLLAVRPGPAGAAPWMGTPLGLAFRLQRASLLGWTASLAVAGLAFGAYANALLEGFEQLPEAFLELFGAEDLLDGYLAYMAVYMAFMVGVYAVMAVQGLRTEETSGRGEPVLATGVGRGAWLGSHLLVSTGGVVVITAITGAATGLGAAIVVGEWRYVGELTLAHLGHVPAVLVVLAVATLLYGLVPRAVPAAWALVGYGLIVGTFGALMDLPPIVHDLSPYEHTAQLPLESFAPAPFLLLIAVACATAGAGILAFRRRGINVT
jgi:ABC-2 type transport system permease protein